MGRAASASAGRFEERARDINLYRHFLLAIVNSDQFAAPPASERASLCLAVGLNLWGS